MALEFGQRPRRLDPGRPAADDDEVGERVPLHRIGRVHGPLEVLQHQAADVEGLADLLHAQRAPRQFVVAEEVGGAAGREHQHVVAQRAHPRAHRSGVEIDPFHLGHPHHQVALALEEFAQRKNDGGGFEPAGRDLVEQRLELMEVVALEQHHLTAGPAQSAGQVDAGEAAADDDDARPLGLGNHDFALLFGVHGRQALPQPPTRTSQQMKSAVTLSLVPSLRGGPWIYWDDLPGSFRKAAALGFDGVELFTAGPGAEGLEAALAETGLALAAVGTGAGKVMHGWYLTSPDAAVRARAVDFIKTMIDFGARHNAPAILGSMQGNDKDVPRPQALDWLAEALEQLGDHAGERGVTFIYEPLNRYETVLFNQVGPAAEFVAGLKTDRVVLLADLFHMNIEEVDIAAALRAAGPRVGHVHLADSNRRPGGGGHTDFAPVGAALRDVGYGGFVSAEALSWPDEDSAARATIETFRRDFAG